MLTRSAARKAALEPETAPAVAPPSGANESARQGWEHLRGTGPAWSDSSSSLSSLSTLTDSSLESLSDLSSWSSVANISPTDTPSTPSRQTPRMLERSPRKAWFPNGESQRIVLIPDSFSPGAMYLRETTKEQRMDDVFNKQWEALMKHKPAPQSQDSDDDTDMDTDVEDCEMSFDEAVDLARARHVQRRPNMAHQTPTARTPKPLGPCGTEIIEENAFWQQSQPSPVRGRGWIEERGGRRALGWEPTELVIN